MPKSYPDFPHHTHIAAYFDAYVDHFGFRDRITLRDRRRARGARAPTAPGTVTLDDGETRRYDALLVANGHHWDPRWPEPAFPGARALRGRPDALARLHGRRPGLLPRQARRRARDGQLGDGHRGRGELLAPRTPTSPRAAARGSSPSTCSAARSTRSATPPRAPVRGPPARSCRRSCGSRSATWSATGCPKPDHRLGEAHPTISDDILSRDRARRDHAEAEHRAADRAHGRASPTAARSRPTSSSTAPATRSRSRSSTRRCISRARQRPAAVPARLPPRRPRRLLRRAAAAARRDHAARRGAVGVDLRPPRRPLRAAARRPTLRADIEAERARDVQALRGLQAPHDAGRLRRLPGGPGEGAPARRASARARAASALPVPPRARPEAAPA